MHFVLQWYAHWHCRGFELSLDRAREETYSPLDSRTSDNYIIGIYHSLTLQKYKTRVESFKRRWKEENCNCELSSQHWWVWTSLTSGTSYIGDLQETCWTIIRNLDAVKGTINSPTYWPFITWSTNKLLWRCCQSISQIKWLLSSWGMQNLSTRKFPHLSLHTIVVNNVQKHVDAQMEHAQLHGLLSSWSKSAACHNRQWAGQFLPLRKVTWNRHLQKWSSW